MKSHNIVIGFFIVIVFLSGCAGTYQRKDAQPVTMGILVDVCGVFDENNKFVTTLGSLGSFLEREMGLHIVPRDKEADRVANATKTPRYYPTHRRVSNLMTWSGQNIADVLVIGNGSAGTKVEVDSSTTLDTLSPIMHHLYFRKKKNQSWEEVLKPHIFLIRGFLLKGTDTHGAMSGNHVYYWTPTK